MRSNYGEAGLSQERIAYLHGRIEKEIEIFAATSHYTAIELAERLGALLLSQGIRASDPVSTLRGNPTTDSKTLATVEMVSSSSSDSSRKMSEEAKEKLRRFHKAKWANMTPRQRTITLNKMKAGRKS